MNEHDVRVYKILKKVKIVTVTNFLIVLKDDGVKGVIRKINEKINDKKIKNNKRDNLTISSYLKNSKKVCVDIIIDSKLNFEQIETKITENFELSNDISTNFILFNNSKNIDNSKKTIDLETLKRLFLDRSFVFVTSKKYNMENFFFGINIVYDNDFIGNIKKLLTDINSLKLISNYDERNCVTVKSGTFYNFEGSNYFSGGAERYLIDLYEIFKNKNINLDIYQNATKPFFRKYNGINVIGMALKDYPLNFDTEFCEKQSQHYINMTRGKSQLHIYSAFFECYPNHVSPSIGISHGIGWDNESNKNLGPLEFWNSKKSIIESAKMCDKLVSVDTNTANWFQTVDYEIGNKKFNVIPNYVDVNEFVPRKDYLKKQDKIIIVYPRRLYKPRGLYIALEAASNLIQKYKNIEFHFVGKGLEQETKDIDSLQKKFPKNIFRYSKSPFEMPKVYKKADISLVPTLYSEGTSLSCLEAMASGNIVISTRIGGLSDLIINGYNGYLIEPNAEALIDTLETVINNYDQQTIIKQRAVEVAKAFNKELWIKRWEKVIDSFKLNKESSTNGLVEFYVNDIDKISTSTFELIKKSLLEKKLVYIRSKKGKENDVISSNLLQLINYNEEVVNKADIVYVEKKLKKEVKREEQIIVI